jgi:hypothetical protein
MMRNLGMGTYVTCRNIILNGFPHLWLLELTRYKLHSFVETKMSYGWKVMTRLENLKSAWTIWNIK